MQCSVVYVDNDLTYCKSFSDFDKAKSFLDDYGEEYEHARIMVDYSAYEELKELYNDLKNIFLKPKRELK